MMSIIKKVLEFFHTDSSSHHEAKIYIKKRVTRLAKERYGCTKVNVNFGVVKPTGEYTKKYGDGVTAYANFCGVYNRFTRNLIRVEITFSKRHLKSLYKYRKVLDQVIDHELAHIKDPESHNGEFAEEMQRLGYINYTDETSDTEIMRNIMLKEYGVNALDFVIEFEYGIEAEVKHGSTSESM